MPVRPQPRLSAAESAALHEFVVGARARLGAVLREVRLFGSRARGEGHEASDLDVALIVEAGGRARRREVQDLAFDIWLRAGTEISPLVIEQPMLDELRARERRLAWDLDHEGVPL